jgi:hypothetical protein
MIDLTDEHITHLDNIINNGLMRTITPEHVEAYLVHNGYVRRAVGGLVATDFGNKSFYEKQKNK